MPDAPDNPPMAHDRNWASSRIVGWPLLLAAAVLSAAGFAASTVATAATGAAAAASPAISRPAPAAAPTRPSAAHYLSSPQVDLVRLLPPPPAADSPAQQADLQAVLDAQRAARTDGTLGQAIADVEASCGRFSDVLGDALTSPSNAGVLEFLNRAAREGASIAGPSKRYWKRIRPYAFSGDVEALGDMAPDWNAKPAMDGGRAANELAHSSYPSGHATFGTVCTILLADMVPEKREALFARGREYAHSRIVVGAHFPSDLEAGRIAGTLATQRLLQNRNFRRDLAAARVKLRAALGLPASAPDLEPQAIYKSAP